METRASRESGLHLHVTDRTPLARVSLREDIVRIPRYFFHVKRCAKMASNSGATRRRKRRVNGAYKKS